MLRLSLNFNLSSLSFFQELITHSNCFYLAMLKSNHIICKLIFLAFLTVHCLKISLKIIFYSSAKHPWELIAVGIVKLPLTITEFWQFFAKNFKKSSKCTVRKNCKTLKISCLLCYYII